MLIQYEQLSLLGSFIFWELVYIQLISLFISEEIREKEKNMGLSSQFIPIYVHVLLACSF